MLSNVEDLTMKQKILQHLWDTLSSIQFLSDLLSNEIMMMNRQSQPLYPPLQTVPNDFQQIPPQTASQIPTANNQFIVQQNQPTFTLEQLANYDGKNGNPAYVAVNSTVYDVTNNAAWAAATHFGLAAGKDLTADFASCHPGQESILRSLPIVGRLA